MSEIKFYNSEFEVVENPMEYAYGSDHKKRGTLDERLPEGKCDVCGGTEWLFSAKDSEEVLEGGKPYIKCLRCGTYTHL